MTEKYANWRKSRRSKAGAECVEVARAIDGSIGVRDSKAKGRGPILEFTQTEWAALLVAIRNQ